jgi:prevent-host-death family protein
MIEVGVYEAKTRFSELLEKVEGGETVVVTRHGKPVARLIADEEVRRAKVQEIIDRMLEERKNRPQVTIEEIIAWKNEGRRF